MSESVGGLSRVAVALAGTETEAVRVGMSSVAVYIVCVR